MPVTLSMRRERHCPRETASQSSRVLNVAGRAQARVARKGLLHSSAPTIDKEDRPTIQWRPQPRRRVGTLWKRVRLCPSREEGLPLRRDCSDKTSAIKKEPAE